MRKNKFTLYGRLLCLVVFPLIACGIIVAITTHTTFKKEVHKEIERELYNTLTLTYNSIDRRYPGDFHIEDDGKYYYLYKGDARLQDDYELMDESKEVTGFDYTIFFGDTRMLTTIKDEKGNRIIGTKAHAVVMEDVFEKEKPKFYDEVLIDGEKYYAYYMPAYNEDGTCVGMLFTGMPSERIRAAMYRSLSPIFIVTAVMVGLSCFICNREARALVLSINLVKKFLQELAGGNFKTHLDLRIQNRSDELGEMGRFTVQVQKSLREMVERDGLTKLYSRRIGTRMLMDTFRKFDRTGSRFCVTLCDIDHFKKFNDTYGHDCGDLVLVETAAVFNKMLFGKGYAIRWGGEEFLLIFEDADFEEGKKLLEKVREVQLQNKIVYKDQPLQVTLTYGMASCEKYQNFEQIVKATDLLLYEGKTHGRNQIVYEQNSEN